ncbi:DNA repair protein RAD51 homolog 4 isoform X2 [Zootermopsis nevadensis]|uniref:DNA repair protein RAD51 homolog 4 isoform X2 n=1 Tax=Zootermopsis nevadensis TaxID=136037 RepID=UPI000B8E824B|nr:DNA repair protein RAD51 homolog 4 isoform X2 [Zootermopsis nevadensis]
MARLCTQMNPLLEERVLKRLHQRKIFTIVDILQENADKLIQITKLSYKEILQIRQNIIANYSAFPVKGIDAYNEILSNTALIPSGIESLDAMIGGGFLTGKIYEVCGSSGSGKTQLCLTVSAHIAHDFKQEVHYIDTKTDFSGKRVQEVLESKGYHDETSLHHDQDGHHSVRIIILDSLPALFFPFLGKNLNDGKISLFFHCKRMSTYELPSYTVLYVMIHLLSGLTLMNQMANTMKYIVTEYHVTFLVVNLAMQLLEEENVAGDGSNECIPQDGNLVICDTMKPALGKYWLDIPCTRLFIHKINSTERRQIAVMKSTSLSTKKRCKVLINQKGVISALGSE